MTKETIIAVAIVTVVILMAPGCVTKPPVITTTVTDPATGTRTTTTQTDVAALNAMNAANLQILSQGVQLALQVAQAVEADITASQAAKAQAQQNATALKAANQQAIAQALSGIKITIPPNIQSIIQQVTSAAPAATK